MQTKCPKCNCTIKKGKNQDVLSLAMLFSDLKSNKKACCDICGTRKKKK